MMLEEKDKYLLRLTPENVSYRAHVYLDDKLIQSWMRDLFLT